jgi:hypothetical protein
MTVPSATTVPRLIGAASAVLGMTLVAIPGRIRDQVSVGGSLPAGWVRLLGARYLAQGLAEIARPQPAVLEASAVVDGLHALSMVALFAAAPTYRRSASLSVVVATAMATANIVTARRMPWGHR